MSYYATVVIRCDASGCKNEWRRATHEDEKNLKGFSAFLAVKRDGWWVSGIPGAMNPDYARCPEHKEGLVKIDVTARFGRAS